MNEVKVNDINLILKALNDFLMHLKRINAHNIDVREFFSFMESIFIKTGYRDNPQGGESKTFACLLVTVMVISFLCRQRFAKLDESTLKLI